MRKYAMTIAGVLLLALFAACGARTVPIPDDPRDKLLGSSEKERPGWTLVAPDSKGDFMFFTGISRRIATEQLARDDAKSNATKAVVQYMGTLVLDKFEKASVDFGLASDIVDPTQSARVFERQFASNLASKVKIKNAYWEKWQTPTGIGYQYFALISVPISAMDANYKRTANDMAKDAERKAKAQSDEIAKAQLQKAQNMWDQLANQGLFE